MSNDPKTPPAASSTDAPGSEIPETEQAGERVSKRLARAGLCSRRDAERWIAEGRVAVNGKVLDTPAVTVTSADRVTVDGQVVPDPEPTRVFRYYKPAGLVTSARDEKGRDTVFDALPREMPRVVSVGRLDLNSEGLLLLTNDGELARHLELPSTGWLRRYRVRVHGNPDEAALARLKDGVFVDGIEYGPIEAELDRVQGSNAWLTVGLREGKNREVRKVMEHLGLPVSRLIRIAYGPFQLGKLEEGDVEEVPRRILRDQLPAFFPKEERRARSAEPVRLRFDQLPKAAAASAPSSATKGGRLEGRRPNARMARDSVERVLNDPNRPQRPERPIRSNDWRDEKPRGHFPDDEQTAPPSRRQAEEEGGIRIRSTRGGRTRPGFETQRAVAARVASRSVPATGDERPARPPRSETSRPPHGARKTGPGERPARGGRSEGFGSERQERAPRGRDFDEGRPARAPRSGGFGEDRPARAPRSGGFGEDRPARGPRGGGYGEDRPARPARGGGYGEDRPARAPRGRDAAPGAGGDRPGRPPHGEAFGGKPGPRGRGPAGGNDRPSGPGRGGPGGPRGAGRGGPGGKGPGGGAKPGGGRGADRRR